MVVATAFQCVKNLRCLERESRKIRSREEIPQEAGWKRLADVENLLLLAFVKRVGIESERGDGGAEVSLLGIDRLNAPPLFFEESALYPHLLETLEDRRDEVRKRLAEIPGGYMNRTRLRELKVLNVKPSSPPLQLDLLTQRLDRERGHGESFGAVSEVMPAVILIRGASPKRFDLVEEKPPMGCQPLRQRIERQEHTVPDSARLEIDEAGDPDLVER